MLAFVLPLLGAAGPALAQSIVTTIITDPLTGVAIDGMDAVSYFTEATPLLGRGDYEFSWVGVPLDFSSAAFLDVLVVSPEIFAQLFVGHG